MGVVCKAEDLTLHRLVALKFLPDDVVQGPQAPALLAAYKDFLTLWKDADPDIPILKQAKAEYAKLH